ncbi:MAG: TonB-dependent receptor [Bacteroidales bacterium]|nr:TonB-dependent receptor [Bacteroidales bacterium]
MLTSILISAGLLLSGLPSDSHESLSDSLHAVTITADKGVTVSRADTLKPGNSFSVSDVLLRSSGFHVGDNGGFAGLKTVSLRGLGSAHTAIYVDGVRVGNVQSGQNDLGMIGTENLASVVVDYAQNSVSFNTARPVFADSPVAGAVRLDGGSFGTWLPSARLDFRLSDKLSLSANASGVFSKGDFTYGDGLVRDNNDVTQVRAGLDLFGIMNGGDYHVKAYYNDVDRGTPGSTSWPSEDRQSDKNGFVQAVMRKNFSPLYTLHLSGKVSYDNLFYASPWGDSNYGQTELQLNTAHDFQIRQWWKMSLAADVQWDDLKSSNYNASRVTAFSALATSFRTARFSADLALEYSGAFDSGYLSRNALSPSANLRLKIVEGLDVLAFGRRAYRVPVFNELYYVDYGNPELKPEDAWLTDVGVDFNRKVSSAWTLKAKLDGFCNLLSNKITSAPTAEDPNIWLPYNIGKVNSLGVDVAAGFVHDGQWNYSFDARYTYHSTVDKTPDSYTYDQQIPYVARHVVVLVADVEWKGWSLNPVWQMRAGRTDSIGELPDWKTLDLTLAKSFNIKNTSLVVKLSAKNLCDCRYETVSGYPMPGRSIMGGFEFKF